MDSGRLARSSYAVCGVSVAAVDLSEAAKLILEAARNGRSLPVHLCNAYTLSLVRSDVKLRAALARADLNLPDGAPIAWLGRGRGTRGPVRGVSLLRRVVDDGQRSGLKHYLYGGADGIASEVAGQLGRRYPGFKLAAAESPPYGAWSRADVGNLAKRVIDAQANVLWIGIGTPRQDYLVADLQEQVPCPIVPVGAAFDFVAGAVAEAPRILHGTGLEWVYRLRRDPRRLWRRYLFGNARFVLHAISDRAQ